MPDIRHRVGIAAPISTVYDAVATRKGVATWWTRDIDGESRPGGTMAFRFGQPEPAAVMEVTELSSPTRVQWRCAEGPDEWKDTTLTFELKENGEETALLFTHGGWREPGEFLHHCSTKWAYFLLGLKAGFEGGEATPWPNDMPIDSWG
ncbi:MAG: SRPBCC domain-containing protein [Acidimicrobiaceae bacterium]|nr:SRPBCC domain-containing protein [Acidimicrobiaceae bacterium]